MTLSRWRIAAIFPGRFWHTGAGRPNKKANRARVLVGIALGVLAQTAVVQAQEAASPMTESAAGPYAVGSTTLFIHDDSRPFDAVAGVNSGVRILITEIWYPVDKASIGKSSRRATYGDYVFGDRDVHRRMMTQTTFFHLTPDTVRPGVSQAQIDAAIEEVFNRPRGSYVDAPAARGKAPFPVVVMTHGDAGSRYNMETVCEHLARNGYIVVAPEHTGNSPFSMIGRDSALSGPDAGLAFRKRMAEVLPLLDDHGVYGTAEEYGQSYTPLAGQAFTPAGLAMFDQSLLQRVNDLRATLAELDRMNQKGALAGLMALDRVGLMGRSFGGATTLAGLLLEPRFVAGMAVVPPAMPDLRAGLPAEALVRGRESAILAAEGGFALSSITKPTLLLSGGEDSLIIGLAASLAKSMGTPAPTPANPHPILRAAYEQTGAPVVWGLLQNSNHGSFGVSGPWWWPQLKPDTFPTTFDPQRSYTLVDSATAHRIQQDKALALFDLTLRRDAGAQARLLANPWADEGFALEARNLK